MSSRSVSMATRKSLMNRRVRITSRPSVILSFSHSLILSFSHSLILSFSHSLILSFAPSLSVSPRLPKEHR